MAVQYITEKRLYLCLSSDISGSTLTGTSWIGAEVYATDTGSWYVVTALNTIATLNRTSGSVSATLGASTANIGDVDVASIAEGNTHIGKVREERVIEQSLVLDNGVAYGNGDVMAITALMGVGTRVNGGSMLPLSMIILDEDNQGGAFDILFFKTMVNIGTINNPYDITDEEMRDYLGRIVVTASDYVTWTNNKTAMIQPGDTGWKISSVLQSASDSTNLYIAAISRDTKTYTTSGIKLRFAISR